MKLPRSKPVHKGFVVRIFGTILTLLLLAFLLVRQWNEIASAFLKIPIAQFLFALLIVFVSRLATIGRWYVLLRSGGVKVSVWQCTRLTFAGLFASNFLPTTIGGDVIRLAGAAQLGLDGAVSAASLIVDRLVGMTGMATMLPWGIGRLLERGLAAGSVQGWVVLGMAPLPFHGWIDKIYQWALKFFRRVLASLGLWLRHPGVLLGALGFTGVHMVCTFYSIWLLLDAMGEPIPFMWVAGTWSLVYFVTLLPVSINGYGLQEVSTVLMYSTLGGISPEASLAVALLSRTLTMIASLPGAIFTPGILAYEHSSPSKSPEGD